MKFSIFLICLLSTSIICSAQFNPLGENKSFVGLDRETGFFIMSGIALSSYFLTKKNSKNLKNDYYQIHFAYFKGDKYRVLMQNFGIERDYTSWFSLRMEGNLQEIITEKYFFTFGLGYKLYSRWSLPLKKKIHPFFEYGAGTFYALKKFPKNGTSFTFNLTYAIGLEYKLKNKNKIRLNYNYIHHSNAGLSDNNPGFDGNGVSFSYSWFWK